MNTKSKKPCLAFIESNTTGTGHLFLKRAIEKGYQVLFITATPEKYSFLKEELVQPIILDTQSETDIHQYLKKINNLTGIFSSSEYYIEITCRLAKKLLFPANTPEAVNICRNKNLLSNELSKANLSCPKTFSINDIDEAKLTLHQQNIAFPIIIKPAKGSGSIGVMLCNTEEECLKQISSLLNENKEKTVLIQEYIVGEEYSVESFGVDNKITIIGITQKHLGALPHFLETGHDFPAELEQTLTDKIHTLVSKSLQAVGLVFGPSHTEIRIKNGTPYIIEINPRLAGGMIPQIIKDAINFDFIDATLSLIAGEKLQHKNLKNEYASIRFIIPEKSGYIHSIQLSSEMKKTLLDFQITKKHEFIKLRGDFRDRIGYLIVKEKSLIKSQRAADAALKNTTLNITNSESAQSTQENTGRLKEAVTAEIQNLLSDYLSSPDKTEEFLLLASIDEAHLLMLIKKKIISKDHAVSLLREIQILKSENFDSLINKPTPRGNYILYENELINRLGIDIAGRTHTARSRNDINATLFKLKLRKCFFNTYRKLWLLRSKIIDQVNFHLDTLLPIYSQYQTALPGTLAHYFLGIEATLSRDQNALKALYYDIDTCPLGACAGGGTTFDIDQSLTANLLGFTNVTSNSLDAVASRDLALRLLSQLTISAMNLSRLTEDLQIWSTNEFKFIEFPDNLAGGSSMMPQKKNPYLLEKIKGRLFRLLGCFTTATITMYKVPFGNSVEIGTEAIYDLFSNADNFHKIVELLGVIIENINLNTVNIKNSLLKNLTLATYITETLVKKENSSFREAHHRVGSTIRAALDSHLNPMNALLSISEHISPDLDPLHAALETEYGGGPGRSSVLKQYFDSVNQLNFDSDWLRVKIKTTQYHESLRLKKIQQLIELIK